MSYGTNLLEAYNQMGVMVGRILKGANIIDLRVIHRQNLNWFSTLVPQKDLGLTIPEHWLRSPTNHRVEADTGHHRRFRLTSAHGTSRLLAAMPP